MIDENLAVYFGDFEGRIIYTPEGYPHPSSKSIDISANFDNEYVDANGVSSTDPSIETHSGEVAAPAVGDKFRVYQPNNQSYVDYIARELEPDGSGVYRFVLEKI